MKGKLIKLSDTHYIIVDDSEIKEGDWMFNYSGVKYNEQVVSQCTKNAAINWQQNMHINNETKSIRDCIKKITHSTQSIENHPDLDYPFFHNVDSISLSEVEEAINGYSVEKMAKQDYQQYNLSAHHGNSTKQDYYDCFIRGFKAHQELVKDKLFTIKDIDNAYIQGRNDESISGNKKKMREEYLQSLLPKTEWDIEFNEQGKIKLI
jgi:hypothetical protein